MRQMRLFIAVNLPVEIKRSLGSFIQVLRRFPLDARWVTEANLHLTLQFLGNVSEERVPAIVQGLNRAAAGVAPFKLVISGTGVFPSVERPRVLWVGVSGETIILTDLHRRVQEEMGLLGFEAERRRFSPHLTLLRIRSPWGFRKLLQKAEEYAERAKSFGETRVVSIELMQSELSPAGAKYYVLASMPLSGLPAV